jgi:exonuclease-1
MGISGLLPVLKSVTESAHVSIYRGKKVAVDGYVWLHRGVFCCARELCEGRPTDKCGPPAHTALIMLFV